MKMNGLNSSQIGIVDTPINVQWKTGVKIRPGIMEGNKIAWLEVINECNQPRNLYKGMTIGTIDVLEPDVRIVKEEENSES